MKYILTPTEYGIEKGKKPLELDTEKAANFAMVINPDCYTLSIKNK